ncbi:MAG TPA: BMP family protein [Anaerolineales bacterium]|nr:BMP family protein [Anaerolineales bacterium]
MLRQKNSQKKFQKVNVWKLLAWAIVLALVLAACSSPASPEETVEVPTALPTAEAQPFRVAVILPSAANDLAFSQSMFDALNRVQNDMGGADKMQFVYSQGMFVIEDAATALQTYASLDYDLVIAHGSQYGDSLKAAAAAYPNVSFVWTNAVTPTHMPNVFDVVAAAEEGGYVNGVLAATLTNSKVIGVVGPVEVGEPKQYVESFKAGVLATDPEVQVLVNYIGSFSDVVKGAEAANEQIAAGADVMTGTSQMVVGPIGAANEKNVLWFGTQSNQSSLAPKIVVSNQVYHWEVALKDVITKIQSGVAGGEYFDLNLANGGIVIEYNPDYALSTKAKALVDATVKGISDGTIAISQP